MGGAVEEEDVDDEIREVWKKGARLEPMKERFDRRRTNVFVNDIMKVMRSGGGGR